MGLALLFLAAGLTTSLAPMTTATSVLRNSSLICSMSQSLS
jgi:hypothetical protein